MADDLSLRLPDRSISGWTSVRVTRSVERTPSDFDIGLTELFPDEVEKLVVEPGETCEVWIGGDRVITGYVDRFVATIGKGSHSVRITGRSKSQDLVDCSAEWPNGQISGANALGIAQKLSEPYGITVAAEADPGKVVPQFNIIIGESAFDIIERVCRYARLLIYDKPDGSVVLAQAGTAKAASGFRQGENVLSARLVWAVDETFSEYSIFSVSMQPFVELGKLMQPVGKATDPNVKRRRAKFTVAESGAAGYDVSKERAEWEAVRRAGRAFTVELVADSWRDSAGKLWEPNTLAGVDLPIIRVDNRELCIGQVTYRRDEQGTRAELMLMAREAFLPQPVVLLPYRRDVVGPNQ